jgi:hypothetical protein
LQITCSGSSSSLVTGAALEVPTWRSTWADLEAGSPRSSRAGQIARTTVGRHSGPRAG